MKNKACLIIFCILASIALSGYSQKVIFLHHSTGGAVYDEGQVAAWIGNYNTRHSTNYEINEKSYPGSPYPWENYPYDYWNLWLNNGCDNTDSNIECLSGLCANYDVIIFKHCFPGSDVLADDPNPSISSSNKNLANYKLQYRALRDLIDTYPNNKFIVWTLVPNHRLSTYDSDAARAKQFVDWVKNEWLSEDGKNHPNIFVFDYWGYVAESDPSPVNGKVNCLKYDFETSHTDNNSHPNTLANEYVGPLFAQFIVNTVENQTLPTGMENNDAVPILFAVNQSELVIRLNENDVCRNFSLCNLFGSKILNFNVTASSYSIDVSSLASGIYIAVLKGNNVTRRVKLFIP